MKRLLVKPAAGHLVRDPDRGRHLAEAGETVPLNRYWRRRLRAGDVLEVKAEKPKPKPAPRRAPPRPKAEPPPAPVEEPEPTTAPTVETSPQDEG